MLRRNHDEPDSPNPNKGELANFKLVRKGYDVEQVDSFLLTQATAWSTELAQARQENAELRAQLARQAQEIEAASLSAQSQAVAHSAGAGPQTDVEIIARAETTAARMLAEADQQAQTRVRAALRAQEEVLTQRQEDLDARFSRAKVQYEQLLVALQTKVGELQETREALVSGLETIAAGGLAAIEGFSNELPPTDLTKPAELTTPPLPNALAETSSNLDRTSDLEAAVAAEIRAVAEAKAAAKQHTTAEVTDDLVQTARGESAEPVEPAVSATAAAEAHIADAESQLVNAEADLASLEQQLSGAATQATIADDEVASPDDELAYADEELPETTGQRALVPPSILGTPQETEATIEHSAVETEGFQTIEDGEAVDDSSGEAASLASGAELQDDDGAPRSADESSDDIEETIEGTSEDDLDGSIGETVENNVENTVEDDPENTVEDDLEDTVDDDLEDSVEGAVKDDEADAADVNDSSVADDDNETSLEEFTATLVDPAWTEEESLYPSADDNVMAAAPASPLATVRPEVDTAEHPITAGGSNGMAASSFQWNEPPS